MRVRVFADLPADNCSLMDGYGASAPHAGRGGRGPGPRAPGTLRLPMRPLPGGNYLLLAQLLDQRRQVLGWTLAPFAVSLPVEIAKLDAGESAFSPGRPLRVPCTISNSYHPLPECLACYAVGRSAGQNPQPFEQAGGNRRGETRVDVLLDLAHAEHCAVRLDVVVVADRLVQARLVALAEQRAVDAAGRFSRRPLRRFLRRLGLLGADMVVGRPRPDLGLRPLPWLDLPSAMGAGVDDCDPAGWKTRRST